jgi:carboxylesterase type B
MIIDGGDNTYNGKPLFRGAIMNSGAVFPAEPVNSTVAQATFDAVAEAGGCTESKSGDRLACLRSLPYENLLNATGAVPSLFTYTGLSISFPPRPDPNDSFFSVSPEKAIQSRRLARVPIITGNQADEGSIFALPLYRGHTTDQLIDNHLVYLYQTAPHDVLKTLINTYSTNPAGV